MINFPTPRPIVFGLMTALAVSNCSASGPETTPIQTDTGTLSFQANGEDFVRKGFITKDGWQISFDHVYVTLDDVKAYQAIPAFDPQKSDQPEAEIEIGLDQAVTLDLAAGDMTADPIQAGVVKAPSGRYNALSWKMINPSDGDAQGYALMMVGVANKDDKTINFSLKFSETLSFMCGDFIGEDRKGLLKGGETADVEATFHFDHLFGDAATPANDDLNTKSLGFAPLAALADGNQLDVNSTDLRAKLSNAEYQNVIEILTGLGHVGEGHCQGTHHPSPLN